MQVPLNEPLMEIPYYYPCNFPLIHEVLKRQGSLSSLSLLANSRLYGLPACSDAGLIKTYFNKLDYAESVWLMQGKNEAPSFEKGLETIRDRLGEGELFLATGSSYELPYCEDYHNPRYIGKLVEPGSPGVHVEVGGQAEADVVVRAQAPPHVGGLGPLAQAGQAGAVEAEAVPHRSPGGEGEHGAGAEPAVEQVEQGGGGVEHRVVLAEAAVGDPHVEHAQAH